VTTAYADASALVKLVIAEPGSVAMHAFVATFDEVVTSQVGIIESRRAAVRRSGSVGLLDSVLAAVGAVELDAAIAATAAILEPSNLRTLDAIHLATALSLYHVDAFVTYDTRLAEAARAVGLTVAAPG
jgi:predicted nucleic acid-binding protein